MPAETLPLPAHHGVRPDEDEVVAPGRADPAGQDPQQLVAAAERGPVPTRAGEDGELAAQEEVLGD